MNKLRKIWSVSLALIIVLGMVSITSSASGTTVTASDTMTHDYLLYKIFKGSIADNDTEAYLGDIDWADGISYTTFMELIRTNDNLKDDFVDCGLTKTGSPPNLTYAVSTTLDKDAKKVAEAIKALSEEDQYELANLLARNISTVWPTGTYTATSYRDGEAVSESGYYLVVDNTKITDIATDKEYFVQNIAMLLLSKYEEINTNVFQKALNITNKVSVPQVEKKVIDENDSNTSSVEGDSADHDINDWVTFKLRAKIQNISNFQTYSIQFYDKIESGGLELYNTVGNLMEFADSLNSTNPGKNIVLSVVKYSTTGGNTTSTETVLNSGARTASVASVNASTANISKEFIVTIMNVKYLVEQYNLTPGDEVVVTYQAKLTANNVVYGNPGNPNKVKLYYTSNPDAVVNASGQYPTKFPDVTDNPTDAENCGYTPPDEVKVYTYKVQVRKVEKDNNNNIIPLVGAKFTLYKDMTGNESANQSLDLEFHPGDTSSETSVNVGGTTRYTENTWTRIGDVVGDGTSTTTFEWAGLDDGIYRIVETTVPKGYNKAEDVIFRVNATHNSDDDDPVLALTSLSTDNIQNAADIASYTDSDPASTSTTGPVLKTDILNNKGLVLPDTGGMGTQIFYVCGGLMLTMGVVLLITKKRMGETD